MQTTEHGRRRWFAVVHPRELTGYALDFYPSEKASYIQELGDAIVGEVATREEAKTLVRVALVMRKNKKGARSNARSAR